jgi:hypothetical protein
MLTLRSSLVALLGIGLLGCGGGSSDGPAAKPGKTNPAGASAVITQASGIQTALMSKNGAQLSGNVNAIAISGAQQIVSPAVGQALTVLEQAQTSNTGTSGTVNCDDSGCTYNMFMAAGFTYNGSIKSADAAGGKHVTTDLTIKGNVASTGVAETIDWKISGALDVSATSINGDLQSTGTGNISGLNVPGAPSSIAYSYFNEVRFNTVGLSNGVANSGSLYARWSITVPQVPQGSQAYDGTVTFPAR